MPSLLSLPLLSIQGTKTKEPTGEFKANYRVSKT